MVPPCWWAKRCQEFFWERRGQQVWPLAKNHWWNTKAPPEIRQADRLKTLFPKNATSWRHAEGLLGHEQGSQCHQCRRPQSSQAHAPCALSKEKHSRESKNFWTTLWSSLGKIWKKNHLHKLLIAAVRLQLPTFWSTSSAFPHWATKTSMARKSDPTDPDGRRPARNPSKCRWTS